MVSESPSKVLQTEGYDPRKSLQHEQQKHHDFDLQTSTKHLHINFTGFPTHESLGSDDYYHQQEEDDDEQHPDRKVENLTALVHSEILAGICETGHILNNLKFIYSGL